MKSSKIRPWIAIISAIASTILIFSIMSCEKEDELTQEIIKEKISGYIQKGPYVNGTQILMVELSPVMKQTGKMFTTQISNNHGAFEINDIKLTSNFVELSASGYYFDEVKGELSSSPLNLFALTDIKDKTSINVNLLTHLEKRRIENLIEHKKQFSEAKKTAQQEILAIFGIEGGSMKNSELLDISVNNDDNAKLLAISVILQGSRSVGELTELLANIANEIHEDGILDNDNLMAELRNSAVALNLPKIRNNLEARYKTLDISASIPDFEKYVLNFLKHTASSPTSISSEATNISDNSATLNAFINPNSLSTVVTFEYGNTPDYGTTIAADQSPVINDNFVEVSVDIENLENSTTYYFRVTAENELGVTYGENATFTTLDERKEKFVGGFGTDEAPYLIGTAEQLDSVRFFVSSHFKQTADIDLKDYHPDYGWIPIKGFSGIYDGNGYKIRNLTINLPEVTNIGLFGNTANSIIKNIGLESVNIVGKENVGGLVGHNEGEITNSYSHGSIKGSYSLGGLVGCNSNGDISGSHAIGSVSMGMNLGGLIGIHRSGNISNCYAASDVTGGTDPLDYVFGGLMGLNSGHISNCYSTGDISGGHKSVGGLIGLNRGTVSDSYALGNASGKENTGGLIGTNESGKISNCYAIGSVSGNVKIGGLLGEHYFQGDLFSSYYDTETTGQDDIGKGIPKTTLEMMQQSTFENWDFTTIWKIVEGSSYPILRWQK